jgi:hypothetical protein
MYNCYAEDVEYSNTQYFCKYTWCTHLPIITTTKTEDDNSYSSSITLQKAVLPWHLSYKQAHNCSNNSMEHRPSWEGWHLLYLICRKKTFLYRQNIKRPKDLSYSGLNKYHQKCFRKVGKNVALTLRLSSTSAFAWHIHCTWNFV